MKISSQKSYTYIANASLQLETKQIHEFSALTDTDVGVIRLHARQEKTGKNSLKYDFM
jgi:hypothetical protein